MASSVTQLTTARTSGFAYMFTADGEAILQTIVPAPAAGTKLIVERIWAYADAEQHFQFDAEDGQIAPFYVAAGKTADIHLNKPCVWPAELPFAVDCVNAGSNSVVIVEGRYE